MKFTFPHMGNTYVSVKVLLDTMGVDYEMPPLCNKKTLEYGTKNSPEFICLPFKTVIGDIIQGLEKGADVVIFGGGCGQCRFGYYGDLLNEILKSLGYKFEYIHLNFSSMSYIDIVKKVKSVIKNISIFKLFWAVVLSIRTVFLVDKLYKKANYIRCRELEKGATDKIIKNFKAEILNAKGYKKVRWLIVNSIKAIKNIQTNKDENPIKIAIVGEIFIACEPFTNLDIEKKLGEMGVEVHNHLSISDWIYEHFILNLIPFRQKNKAHIAAREFINTDDIGGHGIETIGNSILSIKKGYDGIIHLYPFTCMPEIVAQSAFGEIQKKYEVPMMSLIIDELSGEAGYVTRIEAFVDMLKIKKSIENADLCEVSI